MVDHIATPPELDLLREPDFTSSAESETPAEEWVAEALPLAACARAYRDAAYAEAKRIVEEAESDYNAALLHARALKDAADAAMETADADDR